jgi:hypothetical protein
MLNRIVTVSFGVPTQFYEWADEVLVIPAVEPVDVDRRAAIKQAMINAVERSWPGDVVVQDDVNFTRDPFESPLTDGTITAFTEPIIPTHWCPRAFRFATAEDKENLLSAWRSDDRPACYGWGGIPKRLYLAGWHQS